MDGVLAGYLVGQRPFTGAAHAGLIGVVLVLLWGTVSGPTLTVWLFGAALSSTLCFLILRRLKREPKARLASFRGAVLLVGLTWGMGTGVLLPELPDPEQLFLVVVLVGLVAGSAMSLVADPASFAILLSSLAFGILVFLTGPDLADATAIVMTVSTGAVGLLSILYRRSHGLLRQYLTTAQRADRATREVLRERKTLEAILTKAPSAIAIVEKNGCILGVNSKFERLFGCQFEDVGGLPLSEVVLADPHLSDPLPELASDLPPSELRRFTREKREIVVLASSGAVEDDDRGVQVVVYDDLSSVISARNAIEEIKEEYRQLVEASPDLVWRVDRNLRWTFANKAATALYDIEPTHLIGQPMFDRVAPHRHEGDQVSMAAVLRGAELVDHRTVHRDISGREIHLSLSMRPVLDESGEIVGAQGVARDVTAIVEGVAGLESARAEAEQHAQSRASFLANVSHEIRTPLNGLLGMTEVLLDSKLDYDQRRSLDLIRTSAESLLSILNDVLDYSKIEAGGLTLEPIAVEISPLVDSVVRVQAFRAFERKIELVYDVRPEVPPRIVADPGRLRQVLSNLVANAVKFTSEGEIVVTVSCGGRQNGEANLRFEVRDTGVGIPPERLEAIFHEYVQTDGSTTRKYGGTGLGLAIARRLVRMMGGELEVASDEGTGSVFSFEIPVRIENQTGRQSSRQRIALVGKRALLVGSNGTSRSIVADQLSRVGVEVLETTDAQSAMEALEAEGTAFSLAIIDAHLSGGLDGFALAEWMREAAPDTGIMMLTAAGQRGDALRCSDLGIAAYLTKPISRTELLEVLASVVSHRTPVSSDGVDQLITRYSIAEIRQRLRVLYAEDNPVNQTVASSMLRKRGHDVTVVGDGRAAVEAASREHFDVVLMDINLPELDGVEATAQIRALSGWGDIPIVAVTAHVQQERREMIMASGFSAYLAKPFRSHEIFAAVEGWDINGESDSLLSGEVENDNPPVAWTELLESMREAGIGEVVPAIIEVFVTDAPNRLEALRSATRANDGPQIEAAAHAFKSAAGTIKANRLAGLLHSLEQVARAGDLDGAATLMDAIGSEYQAVHLFLHTPEVVT